MSGFTDYKKLYEEESRYTDNLRKNLDESNTKLAIARAAFNKIGILQMGELDYTQDFFEIVKQMVRITLKEIE